MVFAKTGVWQDSGREWFSRCEQTKSKYSPRKGLKWSPKFLEGREQYRFVKNKN